MEVEVKKQILDWLKSQKFVGHVQDNDKKMTRMRKYTRTKDLPDLQGNFVGGRAFYFEIKDPSNKKREFGQLQFIEERRRDGCVSAFIDSVDVLKIYLRAEGYL